MTDPSLIDASAPETAKVWDGACGIADASDTAQDGAFGTPGWRCAVPAMAQSFATCQAGSPANFVAPCGPTAYQLHCSEEIDASSLGCDYVGGEVSPTRSYDYCCFCEGTDAATGCVDVDLSTYDRSCNKDSDCVEITSGRMCPGGCSCGGSAINVDGLCRYDQTVAPLASYGVACNCPADFGACCRAGRCVDDFCCLNSCPDAGAGD